MDSLSTSVTAAPLAAASAAGATGWQRFLRNRVAVVSLVILGILTAACIVLPIFLHPGGKDPSANTFRPPGTTGNVTVKVDGVEEVQSMNYVLGTDVSGRDLLRRILEGGRVSILIGACGALLSLVIGVGIGLTAGYFGGWLDSVLMRAVDVFYAIPRLLFMLVVIAALGPPFEGFLKDQIKSAEASGSTFWLGLLSAAVPYSRILIMILCLGMIEWLTMARIVRGQVLVLKEQTFVAAARVLGRNPWQIMIRHLLPNLWTVILTYLTLTVPVVILDESFLSFLGLGIEEPAASWGSLLKEGAQALNPLEMRWWLLIFPAAIMSLTLLALNFVGDGLRDAFDVK